MLHYNFFPASSDVEREFRVMLARCIARESDSSNRELVNNLETLDNVSVRTAHV